MTTHAEKITAWIDAHFDEEVAFLQQVVQQPTDTPPGNNAPHAELVAQLLQAYGWQAEQHAVPADQVEAYGMQSITNLIVRRRYGAGGRTIALNAHGDVVPPGEGWTHDPYGGEIVDGQMLAAPRPSARATSPPSASPCARWRRWRNPRAAPWNCISPTTRSSAANWAPAGCWRRV